MTFYTYMWLRENGTPYYVGKGTRDRAFKKRRIGKAPSRDRILIQEFPSEEDALFAEKLLISYYGREDLLEGCLLNLTDGGDAPPNLKGKKRSIEAINRWRKSRAGWKHSDEAKRKISIGHIGLPSKRKGIPLPEEVKNKISQTLKRKGICPRNYA